MRDRDPALMSDAELFDAVDAWFDQALTAFEGAPDPSANYGKALVVECRRRREMGG